MLASQVRHAVVIPVGFQPGVAIPAVGVDDAAGRDGLGDKGLQRLGSTIGDAPHPDAADGSAPLLGRHHDQGFLRRGPATPAAEPTQPSRPRRVRSDGPAPVEPWPVAAWQPRPRRLIAAQAQDVLQGDGAGAGLLAGHPPHSAKPGPRRARVLKDGARGDRGLPATPRTLPPPRSQWPRLGASTAGALKAGGPAQACEVRGAGLLGIEPSFELGQRPGVLVHGREHYILGSPESIG